ncbi:hypothetical protein ABZ929_03310 [Streptomyces physcomitrii]|uniref:hypothetical protein n=1 Tax=Streptomyces physcomitrii TaxID=2724184 RepID=UPI00340525A0
MTKTTFLRRARTALCACGLLGAALSGPLAPASLAADQNEPRCLGLPDGDYTNPNNSRSFFSCHGERYVRVLPCARDAQDKPLHFTDRPGPTAEGPAHCAPREKAPADLTPSLTAGQARTSTLYPYVVQGLNATVTREDGSALFGAKITFTAADGTHLCSAYADKDGRALCDSEPVSVNADTLRLGYTATFPGSGDGIWNPAQSQGGITVA